MNILHFKYAVEIAKTKSISKAAESLFMGQPTLSRAIKELEEELGITIFNRNTKGISLTPEGAEFLQYAKQIITQVEEVEQIYKYGKTKKQKFSICVPRASYICDAMANFASKISLEYPTEIFYKETNSMRTITNVLNEEYKMGIIRYEASFEKYFDNLFEDKKLKAKVISEFTYRIIFSADSSLASKDDIKSEELSDFIEVSHADRFVPSLPIIDVKKAELSTYVDKRFFVFERASQFQFLEKCDNSFMWASPVPKELLDKYNLVQMRAKANERIYKDVLIYRKEYKLTELDKLFVNELSGATKCFMDN